MEKNDNQTESTMEESEDIAYEIVNQTIPENEEEHKQVKRQNKNKWRQNRPSGFLGGILGGLIASVIMLLLFTNNILPIKQEIEENKHPEQVVGESATAMKDLLSTDDQTPMGISEVSKAVVGIINLKQQNIWMPSEEAGSGSGIIYKKENGKAYVVTNNHVVEGAEEVEIDLENEKRLKAKVLGTDQLTDLAVLEIDGSDIEVVAKLGVSGELQVGETVFAIGNPLGMDFSGSVTKGIISGLNRSVQVDTSGNNQPDWITEVIQTDAAINPGNSGGALINTNGEIIGINSMKVARSAVEGIGFAIPIDAALPIMQQLETGGKVSRPFIGITTTELSQVPDQFRHQITLPENIQNGMVIADVQTGSPAEEAGLQQFDVITKINEQDIASLLDLRRYMYSEVNVGDTVDLEIYRNGKQQHIKLHLTAREI